MLFVCGGNILSKKEAEQANNGVNHPLFFKRLLTELSVLGELRQLLMGEVINHKHHVTFI